MSSKRDWEQDGAEGVQVLPPASGAGTHRPHRVETPPMGTSVIALEGGGSSPLKSLLIRIGTLLQQPRIAAICALVLGESLLLVMSLVPPTTAIRLGWSATNGPFPVATAPLITALFYLAPLAIGVLARRWEVAVLAATFPAWLGIGISSVATSTHNGIFALTSGTHPATLVGMMELFAALGGLGWLLRHVVSNESSTR